MNQLPYDNLDQLAEVLQTVFTGNNTTIQQANDVLMQMAVDPQRFIDAMMNIITSEKSDQNVQKIKKAAAMVTLRILSPFIENKKSPPDQKQYILEAIIKALYSPHVITTIKASLQQFLSVIYYADSTGVFKEQSLNLAKEKLAQGQLNDYAASLYIILPIIENPSNSLGALSNWFEYLLEDLLNAGDNIIEGVGVEILDILKGENHEQKVVNVFMGLEILKVWTQIIFEFIKRLGKEEVETITKASYIEHVVDKEKIGRTLLKTLILQIPTEHQIKGCMFSTSGVKQLDQLLNTVKMITVQCFEKILYFMVEAAKVQSKSKILNANHNKLYTLIQTDGFKAILQSLMHLCKNNYTVLEKNLMDKQFQECVSECLGILAKLTAFQELYTPFSDYKNMIIMDICLPLIASTKKDIIMFSEDPQSFVNITSNIEEDQETQNVKLQAIQFLRRICENIDGAMSSLIMLVGMLIDFTLKSNDLSIIEEKYPKLADYKESLFVAAIEPRIRVETSLLVLASVNEFTQTRPDLMQIIDSLFTEYHEYFLGAELDPLIKSRMCLFLGSFVSSLFKKEENKELYAQHLRFLVECAGITSEQQQAVTEQANQTLYDMLAEKQHVLRMAPLIPDILEKLISYTKTTQCITFFDVLHEIVRLYSHFISQNPELLLKVISDLVERGKAEYEFLLNDKGLSKLTLTKIWNIIKIIGEKESYLKYQDEIEKVLVPLFNFIIENESQPYDDDLLGYISSTIKVAKRVSPVDWEIFRFIPTIFERYQNLITPIFATLNNIIVYGREVIEENAEIKHQLIDIGIKAINTTHPDAGPAAISLGAVLFQILIQYVGIPNEEWERMLVACIEKLHGSDKSFLKARIGGVFLLAFMRNFEFTQACLLQHNALGVVLELFTNINHAVVFDSHVYDRKVFLIALSTLLTQENANVMIKEKYPQILDILISFLGYVQHVERERAVSGNKRKIAPGNDSDSDEEEKDGVATNRYILKSLLDNNSTLNPSELKNRYDFDDDDDDDDDDEDDDEDEDDDAEDGDGEAYFPTEKDEANHYVTHLVSDIKTQDEFTEFKNAIQKLKQIDQQLLGRLAVSLPERKKILMKEVLQSQRVVVSSEGKQQVGATRKMVKTVGRKVATVNNQP